MTTEESFEALVSSDWRIETALNNLFNQTMPPPQTEHLHPQDETPEEEEIPPNEENFLVELTRLFFRALSRLVLD